MLFRAAAPYTGRRYASSIANQYSNKVYAFPFVTSAETATSILSAIRAIKKPYGSPTLLRGLRSIFALCFNDNLHLFKPTSVQAVYFPAWFVHGVVRTQITIPGSDFSQNVITYLPGSRPSYYPGTAHTWLSNLVFAINGPNRALPMELSEMPLSPSTGEIKWLPFTRSPLNLVSAIGPVPDVAGLYTLKPEIDFLSASPLLIPIYVVGFEHETNKDLYLECAYDASSSSLSHISIAVRHVDPDHPVNYGRYHRCVSGNNGGTLLTIDTHSDKPLPEGVIPATNKLLSTFLQKETQDLLHSDAPIDGSFEFMEDLRVRPYSEIESITGSIYEYYNAERMRSRFLKLSQNLLPGKQMTFQTSSGTKKSSDEVARILKFGTTPGLGRNLWLETAAPDWWKKWMESQTPIALAREKKRREDRLREERRRALLASAQGPKINLLPLPTKELNATRKNEEKFAKFVERREKRLLEEKRAEKEAAIRLAKAKAEAQPPPSEPELQSEAESPSISEVGAQYEDSPMFKLRSLAAEFRSRLSG